MSFTRILKSPKILTLLFFVLYTLLMFRVVWPADAVIQSTDFNYGLMGFYKSEMPDSLLHGFWRSFPLLGRVGFPMPTWTNLSLAALPLDVYMDWIYGINLALSALFLTAFLRLKGISWPAALTGAVTAFWLGSNLTLVLAGHLEKYGVVLFASVSLYTLEQTLRNRSIRWSILSGGALGMMFMHQPDIALFFGLVLGAWFAFELLTRIGKQPKAWAVCALPLLVPALLLTFETYRFSMQTQVRDVTVLEAGTDTEKWGFITQWSWPPSESIDLIAPGFMGWYSGHPKAPYHGVMGQGPDFAEKQSGPINFKLESQYLGILPLGLAFLAFGMALSSKRTNPERRRQILFWSAAVLVTFLLACGKFTPLYRLFIQLPLVGSIRNPNKFLQVFQVALGILTAYGLDLLLKTEFSPRLRRIIMGSFLCVAIGAGLGALLTNAADPVQLSAFQDTPWKAQAATLLENRQQSWLHLTLFAAAGSLLVFATAKPKVKRWVPFAFLALISFDGLLISRPYLQPYNTTFLKRNPMADFLQDHIGENRVALLETSGIYSTYLTHLFPYRGIPFANISVAPRLHQDYENYMHALVPDDRELLKQSGILPLYMLQGLWIPLTQYESYRRNLDFASISRNQVRYWQEFGVSHVLARQNTWDFLKQLPGYKESLQEVYRYELNHDPGGHVILALTHPGPRFALLSHWSSATVGESMEAIRAGEEPLTHARVQAEIPPGNVSEDPGTIQSITETPTGFTLKVLVKEDSAFLRIADKYSPDLVAKVNGGPPQPLLQTDGLFCGLVLEHGVHELEIGFHTPSLGRNLQWTGLLLCMLALLVPAGLNLYRYVFTDS
jgi:hypothetical protein